MNSLSFIIKQLLCKVRIILGGIKQQHFGLHPDHFELFNAPNLRVISFLILKILLLHPNLPFLLKDNNVLIKRTYVFLLISNLRILDPSIDCLIILRR